MLRAGVWGREITLLNVKPTVIECETLRGFHPSAAGLSPAPGNESKNPRGASFSLGRNTDQPCQRAGGTPAPGIKTKMRPYGLLELF
jgi:hypothetical protein